jgi:hypothetical protein
MFVSCLIRRSRNNQQYALIYTTHLFYILASTCFSSSLPSSGSFLDPSELLEIEIDWVDIIQCVVTWLRSHTLYDTPPILFVFQVTQKVLRSSLMLGGYCRNT